MKTGNIFIYTMIKQEWDSADTPKFNKRQHSRIIKTPRQQPQSNDNIYQQLLTANPILPPGVHNGHNENHFLRFKHIKDKQSRLNKTLFPQVRVRNWFNNSQMKIQSSSYHYNATLTAIKSKEKEEQYENVKCQYNELIQNKQMIYCRFNNKKCNSFGKGQPGLFCSLFINHKKQEIKSKRIPVFEYLPKVYKFMSPQELFEDTMTFSSSFESGNLLYAFKCPDQIMPAYELYMHNDTNSKGCTQWFYFSATSQRRMKIKFRIMNFYKSSSLYNSGMKILISTDQIEWKRIGTAIKYDKNELPDGKQSYYLQFIYEIEKPQKKYYFSSSLPYTSLRLENTLNMLSQELIFSKVAMKTVLCHTYLGNPCYMLTISNNLRDKSNSKPIIYIIARQHPGQTPGSYIVEGLIKTLLTNRIQMNQLRDKFVIKVVPMVNVDGVINGNYRTNFSGRDLNRQWFGPSRKLHPEVFFLKQQIVSNKKNAYFFLDIHAHSRKMDSFFYGSSSADLSNKLYPFTCSKLSKYVNFKECSFGDDPSKKSTARVVLESEASIKKSLTFEASFYGYYDEEKKQKIHFKQQHLRSLGETLALGFYYSQIGVQKVEQKLKGLQKNQEIEKEDIHFTTSFKSEAKNKKKQENLIKIENNSIRILQKWKKEVQKHKVLNEDLCSQGSSLNPEHFELSQIEQMNIPNVIQKSHSHQKLELNSHRSSIPQQKEQKQDKDNDEKLRNQSTLFEREMNKQGQLVVYETQSNLKNSLMIRKLQSQIKGYKSHRRYESTSEQKQKQQNGQKHLVFKNEMVRGERFKSLQIGMKEENSYRNNIIELKKALAYFISHKNNESKPINYDQYKRNIKYTTIDTLNLTPTQKWMVENHREKNSKI